MEGSCSEAVFALPASPNDQLSPSPVRTEESRKQRFGSPLVPHRPRSGPPLSHPHHRAFQGISPPGTGRRLPVARRRRSVPQCEHLAAELLESCPGASRKRLDPTPSPDHLEELTNPTARAWHVVCKLKRLRVERVRPSIPA